MAQQTIVTLTDDLDPELAADETVTYALDGVTYEIDLNAMHAADLRVKLAPYIEVSRKLAVKVAKPSKANPAPGARDRQRAERIRTWATQAGYEVSPRGRIPATVVDAYLAAGNS